MYRKVRGILGKYLEEGEEIKIYVVVQ